MITFIDFREIEKKWQRKWEEAKIFEANVDPKRKKFFVTFPYPYVNGAPHVGHSYSFFRVDAFARFKRMQGYNVLFPQGFHATGEPLLGAIERLKKGDKIQIRTFKLFGASDEDIEKFKKDVVFAAKFWMKRFIEDFKASGASIDWRRTFITTTITPQYSRFIEWQYNTLRKLGYVTQGTHPVIWCPNCKSPTGDHDRLRGEGESPIDYILIKFETKDGRILPCGTLRPETTYGVTNLWINPDVDYVWVKIKKKGKHVIETWLLSEQAIEKLKDQLREIERVKEIKGKELLGKRVRNPVTGTEVPILPADFVDPDNATGIVMSVPSHAPYDWIGIKELIESGELEEYGVTKDELEPISLIKLEGYGEHPAIEVCERMGIKNTKERDKLEEATRLVYKKEFHKGVLKENCGEYAGMKVSEAKEKITKDFIDRGVADIMWETSGEVVCRCTTKCHVKILENQWFLRFSDESWKELARKCLARMKIFPKEIRSNFENTIEWLKDKACTRKTGLGTPLPWDKEWIIETLSDSTIYMAYYTIARVINERNVPAEKLTDDVFDYVFLGKGKVDEVAKSSGLDKEIIEEMKREFDYFYPVDFRGSGKDLVQNHLTFFIFHHVAIWKDMPEKWPRMIGVNGFVRVEGEKMSKSKGNVIPLRDLIKQFGADLVRINIVASSEGLEDADWRAENIKSYRSRIELIFKLINDLERMKSKEVRNVDKFLLSRLQKHVKSTTDFFEELRFRSGVNSCLFEATNDLKWYLSRVGNLENANQETLKEALSTLVRLLAPLTPHVCEEMWSMLGNKSFVSVAEWPKVKEEFLNEKAELGEGLVKQTYEDIHQVLKLIGKKPKRIRIIVAPNWKFEVYKRVVKESKVDMKSIVKKYGKDKQVIEYCKGLMKRLHELPKKFVGREAQEKVLKEAREFLEREFGCEVVVECAEESRVEKAKQADVLKPGIYIES